MANSLERKTINDVKLNADDNRVVALRHDVGREYIEVGIIKLRDRTEHVISFKAAYRLYNYLNSTQKSSHIDIAGIGLLSVYEIAAVRCETRVVELEGFKLAPPVMTRDANGYESVATYYAAMTLDAKIIALENKKRGAYSQYTVIRNNADGTVRVVYNKVLREGDTQHDKATPQDIEAYRKIRGCV